MLASIVTDKSSQTPVSPRHASRALYARLLGSSWPQLADPVRVIHGADATVRARGQLRVTHGGSQLSRLVALMLRFPRATDAADTRLVITPGADGEMWLRTFGDRRLDTRQYEAAGSELAERIGVLEFRFRLEAVAGSLLFRQREAALVLGSIRLPLPASCVPRVDAREDAAGADRVCVYVCVTCPLLGPILTYDGTVEIEDVRA